LKKKFQSDRSTGDKTHSTKINAEIAPNNAGTSIDSMSSSSSDAPSITENAKTFKFASDGRRGMKPNAMQVLSLIQNTDNHANSQQLAQAMAGTVSSKRTIDNRDIKQTDLKRICFLDYAKIDEFKIISLI
jgi:hypothetical protein